MLSLSLSVLLFFSVKAAHTCCYYCRQALKLYLRSPFPWNWPAENSPRLHILFLSLTCYILQHEMQTRAAVLHVNVFLCSGSRLTVLCFRWVVNCKCTSGWWRTRLSCNYQSRVQLPGRGLSKRPWGVRPLKKFGVYRLRPSWVAKKAGA